MTSFSTAVRDYMTTAVFTIGPDRPLVDAQKQIEGHGISALPVVNDAGDAVGILSLTDLVRVGRHGAVALGRRPLLSLPAKTVADVMHTELVTVSAEATLCEVVEKMVARHVHRVLVVDGGRLIGVCSTRDVMRAVVEQRVETPISEFMTSPVVTVGVGETLSRATEQLQASRVRGLVVVDDEAPVGVFTQFEALCARNFPGDAHVEDAMSYEMICIDLKTPVFRAAGQAVAMSVRRLLAVKHRRLCGILTGIDIARIATML